MTIDLDGAIQMPIIDRRGHLHVIGPRTSAIRYLLGQRVTNLDFITDLSDWGEWGSGGPLDTRPPELWTDQIHDAAWDGEVIA